MPGAGELGDQDNRRQVCQDRELEFKISQYGFARFLCDMRILQECLG